MKGLIYKKKSVQCRVVGEVKYENLVSNEFLESNCHRKEVSDQTLRDT